ncbi:MAG: L,D-transpeptidase family protein [Candidatus Porifericomitaceae bacterium WSBS_2022_MAG_OTU9]
MTQLHIELASQKLWLQSPPQPPRCFVVSTAVNGPGEVQDSGCTPRGHHEIAEKIGSACPMNTVFRGRLPTAEPYSVELARQKPCDDWILTRILWLRGLEPGRNSGAGCDSYKRYIYIHGAPDRVPMGVPLSNGCIRMRNDDIIALFDLVSVGDQVWIK